MKTPLSTEQQFREWYARNHPWDWFTKEMGQPVPSSVRLRTWAICKAAWEHRDYPEGAQGERDED